MRPLTLTLTLTLMMVEEIDAATQPAQRKQAVAEAKEPALVQQQEVLAALTLTRT